MFGGIGAILTVGVEKLEAVLDSIASPDAVDLLRGKC